MITTCRIDYSGLNRGLALAGKFTSKIPSEAANFAGKEVAYGAFRNTTKTTPQRVDMDLSVTPTYIKTRTGKINKKKTTYSVPDYTLAMFIILARINPNSNYNKLTNNRYLIPFNPFPPGSFDRNNPGASMIMADFVNKMIKGRHSSANGFIAAGWLPAFKRLKTLVSTNYGGGSIDPAARAGYNDQLGDVDPARAGDVNARCTIENDVGLEGLLAQSSNKALMEYGTPALQRAIDIEGVKQLNYFLRKAGEAELEIPVNAAWA